MLASTLQVRTTVIYARFLSTIAWSWVVWWSAFWIWSQFVKRVTSSPPRTSTVRCPIYTWFWNKERLSRMHSKYPWKSTPRKLKKTSTLFARESSPAFWTTTTSAEPRRRKHATRTRCQRESWIYSRGRLLRRWWPSRSNRTALARSTNLLWSPSEVPRPCERNIVCLSNHLHSFHTHDYLKKCVNDSMLMFEVYCSSLSLDDSPHFISLISR